MFSNWGQVLVQGTSSARYGKQVSKTRPRLINVSNAHQPPQAQEYPNPLQDTRNCSDRSTESPVRFLSRNSTGPNVRSTPYCKEICRGGECPTAATSLLVANRNVTENGAPVEVGGDGRTEHLCHRRRRGAHRIRSSQTGTVHQILLAWDRLPQGRIRSHSWIIVPASGKRIPVPAPTIITIRNMFLLISLLQVAGLQGVFQRRVSTQNNR